MAACAGRLAPGDSELLGYGTLCQGRVAFLLPGSEKTYTSIDLPAGRLKLLIVAESEPETSNDMPDLANYACIFSSKHEIEFSSEPGKVYRFHLDRAASKDFVISVHKGIDDSAIETVPVSASSKQLGVARRCGFYGAGCAGLP
jgi:hypothetical protein